MDKIRNYQEIINTKDNLLYIVQTKIGPVSMRRRRRKVLIIGTLGLHIEKFSQQVLNHESVKQTWSIFTASKRA